METGSHFDVANIHFGNEAKTYVALIEESSRLAKNYDGSEEAYKSLTGSLENLEETVSNFSSFQDMPKSDRDIAAALKFTPDNPLDIKQLLEMAVASRNQILDDSLKMPDEAEESTASNERFRKEKILVLHIDGVFLPTNKQLIQRDGSGSRKFEIPRFQERLQELLKILESIGVYSDDIIIMTGKTDPNQMRKISYAAVRIPRLERSILVCDQINEATFVIRGDTSAEELLTMSKEELQTKLANNIQKVEHHNQKKWEERIRDLLISDSTWDEPDKPIVPKTSIPKIDVRKFRMDDLRNKIIAKIGTPEQFVKLSGLDRRKFFVEGIGVYALSRLFGVEGNALGKNTDWLQFGLKIFPEDALIKKHLENESRSLEEWIEIIKKDYTPEKWILAEPKKHDIKFGGTLSLASFASSLGYSIKKRLTKKEFFEVGLKIWPDNELIKKEFDFENRSLDQWRAIITSQLTPEKWVSMTQREKLLLKIDGVGLQRLGGLFMVPAPILGKPVFYYDLGLKIWPDNELIKSTKESYQNKYESISNVNKLSPAECIDLVKQAYSPEEWLTMKRRNFNLNGLTIHSLAHKLGVAGDALLDLVFYRLSTIIFPNNDIFVKKLKEAENRARNLKERSREEWQQLISKQMTPEQWINTGKMKRRDLDFDGIKITALSKIFGIEGNCLENTASYLKLGLAIWPGNHTIQDKLDGLS